jgi:glycosyltransferase involved in cell wall biosynthesis
MKVGVMLSPGIIFPSLIKPQYLDYFDMLASLSRKHDLFVAGNIVERLPFVSAQITHSQLDSNSLKSVITKFNSTLLRQSNRNSIISKLRERYNESGSSRLETSCKVFFAENEVDAFYAFPFYPETFYVSIAKKFSKPLICEFWEDQVVFNAEFMHAQNYDQQTIKQEMDRRYDWFKTIVGSSSCIIVPSHVFKKKLETINVGKQINVVRVCANRQSESDSSSLKRRYGIQDHIVIYHSSSVSPWHDIDTLFSAVQKMKNKSRVILVLTGDRKILEEKMQDAAGVRAIITGTLNQEEASKHLQMADICVAPYRFHYSSGFFPGKIVRYMMAGKAVVATNLDEVKEVLSEAGLFVPQCDSDEFAKSLDLLVDNNDLRYKLGQSAMRIALERYQWEVHSKEVSKVLRELYTTGTDTQD